MKTRTYQKHEVAIAIRTLIDNIDKIYYRSIFANQDNFQMFMEELYCRLLSKDLENCTMTEEEL